MLLGLEDVLQSQSFLGFQPIGFLQLAPLTDHVIIRIVSSPSDGRPLGDRWAPDRFQLAPCVAVTTAPAITVCGDIPSVPVSSFAH
jgi:hypothetical protein